MFLLKWIVYILVFIYSIFLFLPKEGIYFKVEEILKEQNILINEKTVKDNYSNLDLEGLDVYFDGLKVVNIDNINLSSYLYETNINLKNLEFEENLENIVKGGVSKLNIKYSVLNPKYLTINGNSSLGLIEGEVDIFNSILKVEITLSQNGKKQIRNLNKYFKLVDGKYVYEYKYR